MQIQISKLGEPLRGAMGHNEVIVALAQDLARRTAAGKADLTDSGGGTAQAAVAPYITAFANVADVSTSSAGETTTRAKLQLVTDALSEIGEKADSILVALGINATTTYVDSTGGTTPDGTIAAIGAVTAVTTGVQAAQLDVIRDRQNDFLFTVATMVNRVARACGTTPVVLSGFDPDVFTLDETPAVIDETATGTAADPAVSKTAADAYLTHMANMVKTLSTALNLATADTVVPRVAVTG